MNVVSKEVERNIKEYFRENLPRYEVLVSEIRRKSSHPDDAHLYMVAAKKKDGSYAVWSGWNDNTRSLNFGHYDLKDLDACHKVMDEFFLGNKRPTEESAVHNVKNQCMGFKRYDVAQESMQGLLSTYLP